MSFKRGLFLTLSLALYSLTGFTQKNYVDADGIIEYHNRIPLSGATLKLYNGSSLVESITTGENGEYHFKLEYNKEYTLEISKDKLVTKMVKYNTVMPEKIRGSWWIGIPINLYEVCPGTDASVFNEPVAIVEFNERKREYRANPDHDDKMRSRIRSFEQKNDNCLEGEFIKLVRNADELYDQKKYEEAKKLYEQANEKRPWEFHASERLDEIDNKLAQQTASENVFDNMVGQGDKLLEAGNLIAAKNAYNRALVIKPSDTYTRKKISEIDKSLNQNAQAQQQVKQQEEQKRREEYNQKIATADAYLSQFKYTEAKANYLAAQQILTTETYPTQKIKEIDETMQRDQLLSQRLAKEKEEKEFANLINQADNAFNNEDYLTAKSAYEKILTIKPFDNYSKQRLSKIEKILADKESQKKQDELAYNKALSAGNLFLQQKKYELAKSEYNKAIALRPDEVLPKTQIIKINQILEEEEIKKQAIQQQEIDYRLAITSGEKYKTQRNFEAAKTSFNNALTIKPNDPIAQSKLNEIENIEKQQSQLAEQRKIDSRYQDVVLAGNQLQAQEKLEEAKLKFQEAQNLKPGESLPTEKLLEIERSKQEKARALALQKTREEAYQKAINDANNAFVSKDYFNARNLYNQALKYKTNDALATSKINEINRTIELQKQQQQALAEKDRKYNEMVAEADNLFDAKDYVRAKSSYNMALGFKPENYPKTQIQKIDNILLLQEQEKQAVLEREKNFAQAIAKADEFYNKKDFYTAKEMYEAALSIKPDDNYSKTRIKNLTAFIAKLEANQAQTGTTTKTVEIKPQATKIPVELKFNDEAELEMYLVELRKMYPEGITHEIYEEKRAVMDRYIIVRNNEANEFRKILYSWGGTEYWINDKPCTSMYFNTQVKQRAGEYYNKVVK